MSSLPSEKLSELRQAIHGHVSKGPVQEKIRACLSVALAQEGGRQLDEGTLLQILEERGLVDQVMKTLDLSATSIRSPRETTTARTNVHVTPTRTRPLKPHPPPPAPQMEGIAPGNSALPQSVKDLGSIRTTDILSSRDTPPPPSSKRCLFLQVLGGRAFLDHLPGPTPCPHAHFTLHIHFRGQRYHSREVACACEPDFREGFLLELKKKRSLSTVAGGDGGEDNVGSMISCSDALSLSDPIQIALTSTNHRGEVDLVGTYNLEWRRVLCEGSGRFAVTVELNGVGPEAKITPGILDLRIDLLPHPSEALHPDLLSAQLGLEKQRRTEKERLFLVYAKQWWKEFLQVRTEHAQRLVKIFAPDEAGVSQMVCCFVQPLKAGHLLDSPRYASRFVSLIPFEKTGSVGRGACCSEMWSNTFAMLVSKKGDCEDHACLLCSLLLGFGLEAYVCIGSKSKALAHAWVMTRSQEVGVVFWESITGQRYLHAPFDPNQQAGLPLPLPTHPYRTIGCVFNDKYFYANCQPSDNITTCRFELQNTSHWKALSTEAIRSVSGVGSCNFCPPVLPPVGDSALAANEIETQLRTLTFQHREDLGLSTVWDDDLCYLLSPALSAYETERCLGVGGVGNEEFQEAIRNSVPDGHTFKGFPIQLPHRNPRKAFQACLRAPVCAEIFGCKGHHVRLAVRVKVYFYPEDICAVWIMFAVKYRSVL